MRFSDVEVNPIIIVLERVKNWQAISSLFPKDNPVLIELAKNAQVNKVLLKFRDVQNLLNAWNTKEAICILSNSDLMNECEQIFSILNIDID